MAKTQLSFVMAMVVSCVQAGEADKVVLEAELMKLTGAEALNFGGVGAAYFQRTDGRMEGTFSTPKVRAELWARVYFPWQRQDRTRDADFPLIHP